MDVNISASSSFDIQKVVDAKVKLSTEEAKIEYDEVESVTNEGKSLKDRVDISAEGMKKSTEADNENNLPDSIQKINKQIKRIQAEMEAVKVKLEEVENSKLSEAAKDQQKQQYQEQLTGLNSALSSAFNELKTAMRELKLDDQSMLTAAMIFS